MKTHIVRLFLGLSLLHFASAPAAQNAAAKPMIYLRAAVDHLRLRAQPNKNAAVVAELSENDQLLFLGESGGVPENITLRGVSHRARWHKVSPVDDPQKKGWVYGGAVAVSSIFLPDGVSPGSIREDFLQIYPVSQHEYEKGDPGAPNGLLRDTAEHRVGRGDSAFVLRFDNGASRILRDTASPEGDGENDIYYRYKGQLTSTVGQYVVEKSGYEWDAVQFWDRRDGKIVNSFDYTYGLPALSPDKKWVALAYADPYETVGGLQILLADATGLYPAFNIQQADQTGKGYWSTTSGEYFFQWEPIMSNDPATYRWFRMKIIP